MKKLNRLWRIFATGLSFTTFGFGGIFLILVAYPLIAISIKDEQKRKIWIRKCIGFCFKFFMFFMQALGLLRFEFNNKDLIKDDQSCLLIANHPTLIDVVAIIAYYPNACCIVKKELWSNIFVKGVVKAAGYIPNDDSIKVLASCKKAIEMGDVLIIFPEGTRTKPGKKMHFQRGAAHMALALECPVRCVEIYCNPITLTKGLPWYRVPERRVDFTVTVKSKIEPHKFIGDDVPRPLAARRVTRLFYDQYCHVDSKMLYQEIWRV